MLTWKIVRVSEVSVLFLKSQIILFKYCVNVENCESFRGFGFIYIYRRENHPKKVVNETKKKGKFSLGFSNSQLFALYLFRRTISATFL